MSKNRNESSSRTKNRVILLQEEKRVCKDVVDDASRTEDLIDASLMVSKKKRRSDHENSANIDAVPTEHDQRKGESEDAGQDMPDVDITQKLAVVSKKVGPLLRAQSLRKKYIPRTTTTKTPITDALIGQGPVDMSPGTKILVTMSPHALSRTGKTCHPHTIDSVTDASCPKPLTTKVTIATNAHALSRTGSIGALSMMNTVTKAPASKHSPPLSRKKRAGASDNTDQAPAPKKSKSTKKPLKTKIKAGALLLPPEFHYPQLDDFDGDVGKWLNAYNNIPTAWKREPTPDDFGNNLLKLSIAINDILVQEHRAKEAWEAAKCKTPGSTREESLITNDLVDDAEAAEGEEVSEHDQFIRAGGAGGDKSE